MKVLIKLVLAFAVLVIGVLFLTGVLNLSLLMKSVKYSASPQGNTYFTTGSDYEGNYVFGGAMQLAINELNANILHSKLQLNLSANDVETRRILNIFNKAEFTTNDLDLQSYYVKSGYGEQTITAINTESKAKFPNKSFKDLMLSLSPRDIISYAYFLKQVAYTIPFTSNYTTFLNESVKGYKATSVDQKKNVQIVDYKSGDNFIVKLELKDNSDELYLAKGYDMTNPLDAIKTINSNILRTTMAEDDIFYAPEIHLDMNRNYFGFTGKSLLNNGFNDYVISYMYEDIKFDMDNVGARVENQAVFGGAITGLPEKHTFKSLELDKPFWVIMKRANSYNPYFVLGVKNSQIMFK